MTTKEPEDLRAVVRAGYAKVATKSAAGGGCCGGSPCGPDDVARSVGYSADELGALPDGSNLGLSCGNPTALASLRPGETVLDLGSGGGLDVFLAARRVGAQGRAIGIDMTPEMLALARRNAQSFRSQAGLDNVEFRLGEIEHLPVPDQSVDVVISNCVLNLSPDKAQVWREIARVLRPGGRVAVSDLGLLQPLPDAIRADLEALVGCVAGAIPVAETRRLMENAGLVDIELVARPEYVRSLLSFQDPLYRRIASLLPAGVGPGDYVTSLDIHARRADRRV
jgi:SAM-dependent methyltransferase